MKRHTLIAAALLSMTLFSCKKEIVKTLNPENNNYSELQGDEIISNIKTFKNEIENPNSESQISLENSIWLAEAAVNFDYDYSNDLYEQNTVSTKLNLDFGTEIITKKSASILYKAAKEVIDNYLNKNKTHKIKLIDIEYKNEFILTLVSGVSSENSRLPINCQPFGATDYWNSYSGKCGNYSGQGTASSAWQELTKKLNANCVTQLCLNGGSIVYTNISSKQIKGSDAAYDNTSIDMNVLNPYDITASIDGITDFCLFFAWGNLAHTCLAPNEMNAYVKSIKYLANKNKPSSSEVINYNITHDFITNGQTNIFHTLTFTFGTKTCYIETN
jgi:hypothetical protein